MRGSIQNNIEIMADCPQDYCADPLGEHGVLACDEVVRGGLPAIVLFECPPDDATDGNEVSAMIESGTAWLVENVKAGIPASSPEEIDAVVSCGESIVVNEARTLSLYDANVSKQNRDFFNTAKQRKFAAALAYNCDSGQCFYINPPKGISVRGNILVPDQNNDVTRFEGTLNWRDKNEPDYVAAPNGIFS